MAKLSRSFLYLSLVLASLLWCGEGTQLSFSSSSITVGQTNSLTITCAVSGVVNVFSVDIYRGTQQTGTHIASMSVIANGNIPANTPTIVDGALAQRASITGQLGSSSGNLRLTINSGISCNDAGYYECHTAFQQNPSNVATKDNRTLESRADPGRINMQLDPQNFLYNVNETITFRCSGDVGKPEQQWYWEFRFPQTSGSVFQPIPANSGDITIGSVIPNGPCQSSGSSSLRYVVQAGDDGKQFRCRVGLNSLHSDNATIDVRSPSGGGNGNPGGSGQPTSGASAGMIVGICLGVLAVIAIVVVLVYFLVFRRRSKDQADYDTGEGKDGPGMEPDTHANPAYSKPHKDPQTIRSQGVDNPTMDGGQERRRHENSRPRRSRSDDDYQNRHGHDNYPERHHRDEYPGHRNRAMDDDDDRYYPEEDGTDGRGYNPNQALGSAV